MEVESAAPTARRIVIERDVPEPAIAGLVEFINKYYLPSKKGLIEPLSYCKIEVSDGFELFWTLKALGPEQAKPLPIVLRINKAAVEIDFPGLDPKDKSLEKAISRTIDEIESVVLSYFQNLKTTSLYFVIGATDERSEAPNQRGMMSNGVKRVFAGNTTSLFLLFTLLSFGLFFVIGVYTVFVLIGGQLVAL